MRSIFIALFLLFVITGSAQAEHGAFYNVDREGEGIFVTTDPKRDLLAFAFFTYWDAVIPILPVPSPAPPDGVATLYNDCPTPYIPGLEIPPSFSPQPPELERPTQYKGGSQAWFIGVGAYADNIALGDLYYYHGTNYPFLHPTLGLTMEYKVAAFMLDGTDKGFDMYLDCNELLPTSLFMCNNVMTFREIIIGEPK